MRPFLTTASPVLLIWCPGIGEGQSETWIHVSVRTKVFCERVKNNYKQRNKMGRRRPPEPRCTLMIDFRDTQSLLLREERSNFSYICPRLKTQKRFLEGVLEHLKRWRPDFSHTTIFVACEAPRPLRGFVIILLLQSLFFHLPVS